MTLGKTLKLSGIFLSAILLIGIPIYYFSTKPIDIDSENRNRAVEVVNNKSIAPEVADIVVGEKGEKLSGRAFAVYDGDTCRIELPGGKVEKIRFAHIDAPEKKQEYGLEAQKFLANMIDGRFITVYVNNTDKYGRKVADVYYDGHYVNAEMVKNGYAWHYKSFDKKGDEVYNMFEKFESKAKSNKVGLWRNAKPEAPWSYRKRVK